MTEIEIDPIYPKINLSKHLQQAKVCPYLLRNAIIDRPNQAWSIDTIQTWILVPSRGNRLVQRRIGSRHTWYQNSYKRLKRTFQIAKPIVPNPDQRCQFTRNEHRDFIQKSTIHQSMDGKSRWADIIIIEWCLRNFKYYWGMRFLEVTAQRDYHVWWKHYLQTTSKITVFDDHFTIEFKSGVSIDIKEWYYSMMLYNP